MELRHSVYRDGHLRALGAVAATFGDLELQLFWALGKAAEIPESKRSIILAGASFNVMLTQLRALVAVDHSETPRAGQFADWANRAHAAAKLRNEAIHSAWLDLEHISPEALALRLKDGTRPDLLRLKPSKAASNKAGVPGHGMSISELERLAEMIDGLVVELAAFDKDGLFDESVSDT